MIVLKPMRLLCVPACVLLACFFFVPPPLSAGVVTQLDSTEKVVALTFDACETITPSYFDETILSYLLQERIPFTVFVGGKFAQRNRTRLAQIAAYDFVTIGNHSMNHPLHMEKLGDGEITREIEDTGKLIRDITGRAAHLFRFPGGNYDERSLRIAEGLGYKVVHWTFAAGDSRKDLTQEELISGVLSETKPGGILIFHINGRGYTTGKALPAIVDGLRKKHFTFVPLEGNIRQ